MKINSAQLKLYFKFLKYLLPYKKQLFLIIILTVGAALLSVANPYLSKLVIDEGLIKKDLRTFIIVIAIGGGIFLLNELISGFSISLNHYVRTKAIFDLHKRIFKYMHRLPFSWFQEKSTGEHLYMLNYDIDVVTNFTITTFSRLLSFLPRLLLTLTLLFYINYKIAIFAFLFSFFLYLPPYYFKKKMQKSWESLLKNSEGTFKSLEELFSHIQLIKIFAKETASTREYLKRLIIEIRIKLKNTRWEIFSGFANRGASKIMAGMVSLYGGYQVIKGELTLGSLTAITGYMYQLMGLQSEFSSFFQSNALGLISCRRLAAILEEKPKLLERKDAKDVIFKEAKIMFRNVSFGYLPEQYILKNINFYIEGGSHIALVGYSGCGKTTLLNLLVRLYDPWEGDIVIDGWNINKLKINSLRRQIGFVLQEPFLWNASIQDNIRYGKQDAHKDELVKAATIVGINDFISQLPEGYLTIIGENACKLSEGQKQRVAIARALIKKPKILILDEALCSLDSQTEDKIMNNIRAEFKDSVLIVVSHRLSTAQKMDWIYFLESPSHIEIGNHQELLERSPRYRELFASQLKKINETEGDTLCFDWKGVPS